MNNYEKFIQEMIEFENKYKDRLTQTFDELSSKVVFKEYASGGEVLHRGYYCPNPVIDMVVGNAKRGRLLKVIRRNSKIDYEYGFDADGKLITIRKHGEVGDMLEFIIRKNEDEYSILFRTFNHKNYISLTSKCTYLNGRIGSYTILTHHDAFDAGSGACDPMDVPHQSIESILLVEGNDFIYENAQLKALKRKWFSNYKGETFESEEMYYFKHDDDGYITSYEVVRPRGMAHTGGEPMRNTYIVSANERRKI